MLHTLEELLQAEMSHLEREVNSFFQSKSSLYVAVILDFER